MASAVNPSAHSATMTKDAMYLFELLRESPDPILIKIGPYANRKGLKPNSIIKRLAGIKARNGLNISTTLGNYERPSIQEGNRKVRVKKETVKKEDPQDESLEHSFAESEDVAGIPIKNTGFTPFINTGIPTPDTSPLATSVSRSFYDQQSISSFEHFAPSSFAFKTEGNGSKRTYEQTTDCEGQGLGYDEGASKKIRVE